MSSLNLKGQVALVTGSGRGLGRAIAETLARGGAHVAIHDLSMESPARYGESKDLSSVAADIGAVGVKCVGVAGDITNEDSVRRLVNEAEKALGPISILVNCAGGDIGAKDTKPNPNNALDVSMDDVRAVIERNLFGTMLMCRAVCPGMKQRNAGAVVNIGSIAGHFGASNEVAYACAKAAILHYTRCLAAELREDGVRVNAVSPGPTMTARFLATRQTDPSMREQSKSLNRYALPQEIADAVAFLCGSESRFISGQVIRVDGAHGLYPG